MGASTKKDRRYKVRSEYCGAIESQLVLRFCGGWIGHAEDTPEGAQVIDVMRKAHDTARMANIGEPVNDIRLAIHGYMVCALWASTDENPMDDEPVITDQSSVDDIDSKTRDRMAEDVADFIAANPNAVAVYIATRKKSDDYTAWEDLGHDLWLTRNGHGTGFLDRYEVRELTRKELDAAASALGETSIYMGDDGRIYA